VQKEKGGSVKGGKGFSKMRQRTLGKSNRNNASSGWSARIGSKKALRNGKRGESLRKMGEVHEEDLLLGRVFQRSSYSGAPNTGIKGNGTKGKGGKRNAK